MTQLESAAQKARLTGQIRSFLDWLGEGRKLTQTGRVGLADARYLVEFLGTSDVIDPEIGGKVFKTKSSEELAYLTKIVEWAKATRLIRVTGTKLAPVKKNSALAPGEGACPPEDCGGSYGFAEFKAVLAGPRTAERAELAQWAGGDYDPDRFDLSAVNSAVAAI
jgi:hypothetical protein